MSVRVSAGNTWSADRPTPLFEGPYFYNDTAGGVGFGRTYDVSLDDERFLMMKAFTSSTGGEVIRPQIIVVQNWFEELRRLVPTN